MGHGQAGSGGCGKEGLSRVAPPYSMEDQVGPCLQAQPDTRPATTTRQPREREGVRPGEAGRRARGSVLRQWTVRAP